MTGELGKVYEPKKNEQLANEIWSSNALFHARTDADKASKSYSIVIPPPNVTAPLHLGHALNNTLQDILVRFRRMQGYNTLWMPGTDHAGIATQTVVEKRILAEEGKKRTDFVRDDFIARVQAWKDEYEATIIEQLKAMGCSCDWERTRFTMDETCAKAVRAAFFKLFQDGLIYRGKRLVNWDPATQTVLADDEVEHETIQGNFWYMRYPLIEPVRGTGFQPVDKYPQEIKKRFGAYLPHWTKTGENYAVTFRLEDAMPLELYKKLRNQRDENIQKAKQKETNVNEEILMEIARLHREKVESYLDEGHGKCFLADERIANLVQAALKYFDGKKYTLIAWAVMPNHVHTILKPCEGCELSDIMHSLKSYTANKANELLCQKGTFWQSEYYDHLIRDEDEFYNQVNYVLNNPVKAGIKDWQWAGVNEDALENSGQAPDGTDHGQDARATTIEYITVATTRPETMLGDTAVAMNPADPRAKLLIGKNVRLPIVGRKIPIIADEHVVLPEHGQDARATDEKAKFSTGFLKVTPAHDPDDWEIGQRHNLGVINVLAPDGTISDKHGWTDWEEIKNPDVENLIGMDRFEAREAVVEWFRQENLLEEVRPYSHEVGHSYRSHVPIEPYLSDQWYIAVKKPIKWHGLPAREPGMWHGHPAHEPRTTGFQPVEDTAKMAVPQLIEGTDVPVNSLAGLALKPLLDKRLRFIPERYAKTYQSWLENLRDWPISRQLWWGHRIPIFRKTENDLKIKKFEILKELVGIFAENYGNDNVYFRSWGLITQKEINMRMKGKEQIQEPYDICACLLIDDKKIEDDLKANGFEQDPDVLDTWFSSALWPFSTMGWPEETAELKEFYPTNVLCTAREIITLWVSRMVMMGQYCIGEIPFTDVYIHAMIQDGEGRKMSKSLGNGIDPLVVIDSHGADAMRFTLASMTTETQDVRMPVVQMTLPDGRQANTSPKFDIGRNFCNKLWNASRFALMNLEGTEPEKFDKQNLTITDKWILSRLAKTISETTKYLEGYKYSEPASLLYKFFWNEFCDWYLEWIKPRMADDAQKDTAQNVLAFVLDQALRLLHPFIPFISEAIFQKLNEIVPERKLKGLAETQSSKSIAIAQWPENIDSFIDEQAEKDIDLIQQAIRTIRDIRNNRNIPPKEILTVSIKTAKENVDVLNRNVELIEQLAGVKEFTAGESVTKPDNANVSITDLMAIYVHYEIDIEAELAKLNKQKEQTESALKNVQAKLSNKNFINKAKPEVVEQARQKLTELTEQLKTIEKHLQELKK